MKIWLAPGPPDPVKASWDPSGETAYSPAAQLSSSVRMMAPGSGFISPVFRSIT